MHSVNPPRRWFWRGMLEHLLDGLQLNSLFLFHTRLCFYVAQQELNQLLAQPQQWQS